MTPLVALPASYAAPDEHTLKDFMKYCNFTLIFST